MPHGTERALLLAPAAIVLAGGIAARLALDALGARERIAPTSFALAQPLATVTGWPAPAGPLVIEIWCATLACAVLAFVVFLRRSISIQACLVATFALGIAAISWPVVFSSDVLAYAAYGREAALGISPYGTAALDPADRIFAAAIVQWGNPPPICAYGPLYVGLAAGAAWLAAGDPFALVWVLRALALAGLLVATLFAYRLGGSSAAAAIGLNPVLAWTAAEGHNDAIALAAVLGGLFLVRKRGAGAAIVALASAIKAPAAVAALALVVSGVRDPRAGRARSAFALAGLALSAIGALPMLAAFVAHRNDAHVGGAAAFGIPAYVESIAGGTAEWAAILAFVGFGGAFGVRALRRGDREGFPVLALTLWYALPNAYPWYGIWLAALMPLAQTRAIRIALVAAPIAGAVRYLPDALAAPPPSVAITSIASLPLALAVASFVRFRPRLESP